MFSMLHVIWTIWEVSRSSYLAFTNLKVEIFGLILEAAFSKICLFLVTCQTTIVQENWYFLLSINTWFAWHLGATNLITVKILFLLVFWKFGWIVHAFWTPSGQPLDQFGWNLAKLLSDSLPTKTVSANFNSCFHFKVIAYFPLGVAIISHPWIYLLVKMKGAHIREIWDTVF